MGPVQLNENTTRYLFQKGLFSKTKGIVKTGAFIPNEGKVSVFRIKGLKEKQIWEIGEKVGLSRKPSLKGRGDIIVNEIIDENLEVVPDTSTHERHADISGWPDDYSSQQLIASKLALKSSLHLL
ncbi:MAG: hypothetical protein ACOC7U_01375 [Spirochaetota bacterium]